MNLPDLDDVKRHLRLDLDHDSETDPELQAFLDAAVDHASQFLGRPIPWADSESSEVPVPPSVRAAILLIVGDLYENREGAIVGVSRTDNPTVDRLLHFYRVGLGV